LLFWRRFRPDVVLGVGGYASDPWYWWRALAIPDSDPGTKQRPGITNRILARLVRVVMIAFDEARRFFPGRKTETIGNPVRSKLVATLTAVADAGEQSASPRILVVVAARALARSMIWC